jgi:predicted NUDIX family NTP pyrophosphohydrolase
MIRSIADKQLKCCYFIYKFQEKMKKSAGILIYRFKENDFQFFLVHPGGPFWKNKDDGAWSLPKGEFEEEDSQAAAKREFREETGFIIDKSLLPLSPVKINSGKTIFPFTAEFDLKEENVKSNYFTMEWPPKSGKQSSFPEVDRAQWFNAEVAAVKINKGQLPILNELIELLKIKS